MTVESIVKNWYAVKTHIEAEAKVKALIEEAVRKQNLSDKIGRIMIPMEQVSEIRHGKKIIQTRKIYAGYIFIEMVIDDQSRMLVLETQGVSGFVGTNSRTPIPMEDHEVDRIIAELEEQLDRPKPKMTYKIGETVKVKEGAFENFEGIVEYIDPEKGTMRLMVLIFGRKTPVDLEYYQVEKI
jgi:transcriptional antiterminator NusG